MISKAMVFAAPLLFCVSILAAQSQPSLPDSQPGQTLTEWLQLCNAPDLTKMAAWDSNHLSPEILKRQKAEDIAKYDLRECTDSGGFQLIEVEKSEPQKLEVLTRTRKTDLYLRMYLDLDTDGKVAGLNFSPDSPPEAALPKDLGDAALARNLKTGVDRVAKTGLFSGIVSIARGTKIIASANGGYANNSSKTPITGGSQFTLGSMGKMFTAAAVGQLVDQKKLAFEDTVGKFFPDFANQTVRDKVTVGMLLSHTSGMGDFLSKRTPEMMKNGVKRASEFLPLFEKDEPRFEPGKGWGYSNAGLALAGAIVEKVSGENYPDYIRKHIFAVAGMADSDPNNIPHQDRRLVTPYTRFSESGPTADWHEAEHDIGSPAGGAISTADDLIRFADALRSGKLVSQSTFAEMIKPHGKPPGGGSYGYAMQIEQVYGRTVVGHGGGFPGVSTHLYLVLDSPYTVVVLSNFDPPADSRAGTKALALTVAKAKQGK
jgi:CubicO group peptidase (beta-lactamase class C family)